MAQNELVDIWQEKTDMLGDLGLNYFFKFSKIYSSVLLPLQTQWFGVLVNQYTFPYLIFQKQKKITLGILDNA